MSEIKFGTDGWRAVISDDFTFDNVKRVAQGIADYVNKDTSTLNVRTRALAIGYDTRFLSDVYAELVARVIASNRIKAILSDRPTPTPAVCYAIKDKGLIGGVMITASHNPAIYNGIKYKMYYGGSAGPEVTKKFEEYLDKGAIKCLGAAELKSKGFLRVEDLMPIQLRSIKNYVNISLIKKTNTKILVDSMYGAGGHYIADILKGGRCAIETMRGGINPSFEGIAPEPKMPNLEQLVAITKKRKFNIGIATDGDADRLGVASPVGRILTGHKVMTLLLLHLLEDRSMRGDVIQTICGTILIERICKKYNLKMRETPVGFKYISELFLNNDILIGGEETGGVAFKDSIPERDGILSGLLILEMMAMRRKSLSDILKSIDKEYGTFEYRRLDVRVPDEKKARLMKYLQKNPPDKILNKKIVTIKDTDGYKFIAEDASWLMLRLSGTEPILRVYSEASNEKKALAILDQGKRIAYSV